MLCNERDKSYIYDILKYSQEVIDIVKDENHNSFVNNRIKRLAIERLIQIIGEAANHLSGDFIQENQDIPWTKIIGLRNKIVHDYGEILTDRIWLIASESIPELMYQIKSKNFI
ncbi:HepT-like ribonuclease domain-containing protein [Treponema socranskii]|uniref:PF01934 family protein n=1 Tax=Treponema socranskii subsp. socranskii VPI DR56BR1116 = ATCC 35536 TaxID=1125725 RepID=U2L2L8_TRESO|nr:HepT-like ribonuclease domain-containing protein [Treponema socranskii]ERF60883.1 PF01934 family protein [Treponema socranskii subsp. socranskii VPI DR56BR1116 = ATCC 35536]ERJ98565.1 PF01934 family protein [Treponema socranskii subsp. socranskii VPI DR56BR1116 = ATCC 35536]